MVAIGGHIQHFRDRHDAVEAGWLVTVLVGIAIFVHIVDVIKMRIGNLLLTGKEMDFSSMGCEALTISSGSTPDAAVFDPIVKWTLTILS